MTEAYLSEGRICFALIVVDETTWVRNVNIIRNGTCLRGMYLPLSGPEVACIPWVNVQACSEEASEGKLRRMDREKRWRRKWGWIGLLMFICIWFEESSDLWQMKYHQAQAILVLNCSSGVPTEYGVLADSPWAVCAMINDGRIPQKVYENWCNRHKGSDFVVWLNWTSWERFKRTMMDL